jgi:hypothetical protein
MTGFSFLIYLTHKNESTADANKVASKFLGGHCVHPDLGEEFIANKVYLVCKVTPLRITKSNFAKNSMCHAEKIAKLKQSSS